MLKWLLLILPLPILAAVCVGSAAQVAIPIYGGQVFPLDGEATTRQFTPSRIGEGATVNLSLPTGFGNDCERMYVAKNWPFAHQVRLQTGYPVGLESDILAIPLNEQGCTTQWPGNNGYGIKCFNHPPCFNSGTWEEEGGQRVNQRADFRSFDSPAGSMLGFVQFLEENSRYTQALSDFKQSGDPDVLIRGIHAAGYATDSLWSNKVISIRKRIEELLAVATVETRVSVGGTCVSSPSRPQDLRASLIDDFGIMMNGFDASHLSWAWEQFCQSSNTRFIKLTKGATIVATTEIISQWIGCAGATSIYLGPFTDKETFQFLMTHELGHFIYNCHPEVVNQSGFIYAHNTEGGVSYYANHANIPPCPTGTSKLMEDSADTVAYYLHPGSNIQTATCAGFRAGPNLQQDFKLHFAWALDLLGPLGTLIPGDSPIAFQLGG